MVIIAARPVEAAESPDGETAAHQRLYAYLRHPQYVGFSLIMLGFLLQWSTLPTLIMFPILVVMYVRLARREEREALTGFGEAYARYAAHTPAFFPCLRPRLTGEQTGVSVVDSLSDQGVL